MSVYGCEHKCKWVCVNMSKNGCEHVCGGVGECEHMSVHECIHA